MVGAGVTTRGARYVLSDGHVLVGLDIFLASFALRPPTSCPLPAIGGEASGSVG